MMLSSPRNDRSSLLLFSVLASISIIIGFVVVYIRAEHPAYVWDFGAYWRQFKDYGSVIASGDANWPGQLLSTVAQSDYNPFAVVPLFPFYWLFGDGRESYVVAIALFYLLPSSIIATLVATDSVGLERGERWIVYVISLTFLPFWAPTLRGMVDIGGLFFLSAATLIAIRTDFLRRRTVIAALALGVLLWAPYLMRRWYAFSIVSFIGFLFLFGLIARLKAGERPMRAILSITWPMMLTGFVVVSLLLIFQYQVVLRVLSTSYGDLYSAYQAPLYIHLITVPQRLGWFVLLAMAGGVLLAIWQGRIYVLFCAACAISTFFLFIRVQQFADHHFLPVAFWLFPAYVTALSFVARGVARGLRLPPSPLQLLPFAVVSTLILLGSVMPAIHRSNSVASFFLPKMRLLPIHLDNYDEYRRLLAFLQSRPDISGKFTVFASSFNLSENLLMTLAPSLEPHVSYSPHIANTQFFLFDNLRSNYVVVTERPESQLAAGSQVNITLAGEMILNGQGFGAAYQRVSGPYHLAGGTTAFIYHRERPVTLAEMKQLIDQLDKTYPGWSAKFSRNMDMMFAARNVDMEPPPASVYEIAPDTFFVHPGANQPTRISLPVDAAISLRPKSLTLAMNAELLKTCPDADGVNATVRLGETELWSGVLVPGDRRDITLPPADGQLDIAVDKRANLGCDHVIASFTFQ